MSKNTMKWTLGLLAVGCLLAIAAPAGAEIIQQKDSANFDWKYEMEVGGFDKRPSETDLDTNSTWDFHEVGNGGSSSVLDGVLTIVGPSGTKATRNFQSNTALEIWPVQAYSYVTGYTFEIRMRIDPEAAEGRDGVCIFGAGLANVSTDGVWGHIKKGSVHWNNGSSVLDTTDNADGEWHTFRVAQEPNLGAVGNELFSVWRDDKLVGSGLSGIHIVTDEITFGDRGSNQNGTFEVDYFRFTDGAYAPIPEPGALALLATGLIGLLCYAWRKRK